MFYFRAMQSFHEMRSFHIHYVKGGAHGNSRRADGARGIRPIGRHPDVDLRDSRLDLDPGVIGIIRV